MFIFLPLLRILQDHMKRVRKPSDWIAEAACPSGELSKKYLQDYYGTGNDSHSVVCRKMGDGKIERTQKLSDL